MSENETFQKLIEIYERNPVIRFLLQLFPVIPAIDAALVAIIENLREERARVFYDEIAEGIRELSPEVIESEDFLHAYFATARAALNTRRREKIRLFARLFVNYVNTGKFEFQETDKYEEYLEILDDLGYRELQILLILREFESKIPRPGNTQSDSEWYETFWNDFEHEVESKLDIPGDELPSILARIERTGLYGNIPISQGLVFGDHRLDTVGRLTPRFEAFLKAIEKQNDPSQE